MGKYSPSVKENNKRKDKAVAEVKALLYRFAHGKYETDADTELIEQISETLSTAADALDNTVGTGEENIEHLSCAVSETVKMLKKTADRDMLHRITECADDLEYTLVLWKDVLDGVTVLPEEESVCKAKASFGIARLNKRLAELKDIRENMSDSALRLSKELAGFDKDLAELDGLMLKEEDERRINDLYKAISALKVKRDTVTVRKENYDTCYYLLDMIYVNAQEIVAAGAFATEEVSKAKALLNINKLKKVLTEPDKALAVLKRMQKEIAQISERTRCIDEKISSLETGSTQVRADALAYKEALLGKQREQATRDDNLTDIKPKEQEQKTEEQ